MEKKLYDLRENFSFKPTHIDERLVKTEFTDGALHLYCSKCEEFFTMYEW